MAKYVRYESGGMVRYGLLNGSEIQPLDGEFPSFNPSSDKPVRLADVKLRAPAVPSKIIAIGPNYHAQLGGKPPPPQPMYWTEPVSAVADPEGTIELPPGHPIVNHEVELAIVIGKRAKDVTEDEARDCIFGYSCMNDVTAGDFATPGAFGGSHYFVDGKIFDTFAPIGPCIETDLDPANLHVETRVNGEVRQSHNTSDQVFSPWKVVSMVSQVMTLLPGDVISTGSPPGVAPIRDGDTVEIEIENIGILRNYVKNRPARTSGA